MDREDLVCLVEVDDQVVDEVIKKSYQADLRNVIIFVLASQSRGRSSRASRRSGSRSFRSSRSSRSSKSGYRRSHSRGRSKSVG